MLKIGNIELKNNVVAAPMAGISNPVFREICKEGGAGLVVTEMVSDKAICYRNTKTLALLETTKKEHPVAIQLFGSEVKSMVEAARYIDKHCDCEIIDINMGCPVPKIVKSGAGSKLMTTPQLAYDIVSNIVRNVSKPVTVKFRLGWDENTINCVEFARLMEKAGASAIALHARTRSQFYEGQANWSYIKLVKESVNIPVFGNGDIKNREDYFRMIEETNCDGVMIARGSIGYKHIFDDCLNNTYKAKEYSKQQVLDCLDHAERLVKFYDNELIAIKQMRGLVGYYLKGFENVRKLRQEINNIKTIEELKNILNKCL